MNNELKPCPFCGSTDIRYSLKITGHFDVRYHASMYCNKCHCYGARTLTTVVKNDDYKGRTTIENDETVKQKRLMLGMRGLINDIKTMYKRRTVVHIQATKRALSV